MIEDRMLIDGTRIDALDKGPNVGLMGAYERRTKMIIGLGARDSISRM
jgi:hypothetical protein